MATASPRYTFFQRLLHWVIALIVFGLLLAGLAFWGLGEDGTVTIFGVNLVTLDQATIGDLYKYHKSFGVLLLVLMVVRLAVRIDKPAPAYDPPIGAFEKLIGGTIHVLFYLLLIAMPIGGWIATMAGGYPVPFFNVTLPNLLPENKAMAEQLFTLHGIGGLVLAVLILLHVGAALKHWRLRDGVMRRISLP